MPNGITEIISLEGVKVFPSMIIRGSINNSKLKDEESCEQNRFLGQMPDSALAESTA